MRQFVITSTQEPYTVRITFVVEAKDWQGVLKQYPDAELVREVK